jgi:Domain of Unknown Function (DUF1080)
MIRTLLALAASAAFVLPLPALAGDDDGWVALTGEHPLDAWRKPTAAWYEAGDAKPDPKDPKKLVPLEGRGVILNGQNGRTRNLLSKTEFGDIEAHFEFMVPKGSNSGIKFEGLYEIQLFDSYGVTKLTANNCCGGVYPRAELLPKYHYLDEGVPPRVNAAKPFGQWQTLDVIFHAPRFDAQGKKTADARLVKVVLNGQVIHEDVALKTPTGHAWHNKEVTKGPILLQADHGPVAFRNIRVRPLGESPSR